MKDEDILVSKLDKDTSLVTSESQESLFKVMTSIYNVESKYHMTNSFYSDNDGEVIFKVEDISRLALNAQNKLSQILEINKIIRLYTNSNDILGKVLETIESNVNGSYDLQYREYNEKADTLIKHFNEQIDLEKLIINSVVTTYGEGNYIMNLKTDKENQYKVEYYPLGVAEISDYCIDGEPWILVNVKELKNRLKKNYPKNKKSKPLFFKNMDEEVKANYPKEVYDAYKNNEDFAKLDMAKTSVIRINNRNRKYGLSPIFKSLKPILRLEEIEKNDQLTTQARGKKIIFQKICKEIVTQKDIGVKWQDAPAYSHNEFIKAWKSNPVIYTGTPWVESISYVEPKNEQTNVQVINQKRSEILTSLGISFLSAEKGAYASAQINIKELMKTIDKITNQLQKIIEKWYRHILIENRIDIKYTPKIKIIDSELLETEIKLNLAQFLFSNLGMSYESTYELLGRDFENEKRRRENENDESMSEVFQPRLNANTMNADALNKDSESGRPLGEDDPDKQGYDNERNKENNV